MKGCFRTDDGSMWWIPKDVDELLHMVKGLPAGANYRLVAGNTGTGVYANDGPYTDFIDVRCDFNLCARYFRNLTCPFKTESYRNTGPKKLPVISNIEFH